ncbi:ATPase, T2SS/T4P/T4SS family (plasmid) [Thalassospira sp. SM2505]
MNHIIHPEQTVIRREMRLIDQITFRPIRPFLDDHKRYPDLQELNINKEGQVILQFRDGRKEFLDVPGITQQWAEDVCQQLASLHGLPYMEGHRTISCRLTGGHRCTAVTGQETVASGIMFSIRVKRHFKATPEKFGLTPDQIETLHKAVKEGWNIIISGATATGKTTFLNMLLDWVPLDVRLFLVQDAPELTAPHADQVEIYIPRHEHARGRRMGAAEVMDVSIRANPGQVVNGELSISNAPFTLFLANEGHKGMKWTMHANNPLECLEGYKTRMALGGHPTSGVVAQLVRNIDLIIQIENHEGRRFVSHMVRPDELPWHMLEGEATELPPLGSGFVMPRTAPPTVAASQFHFRNYVRAQRAQFRTYRQNVETNLGVLDPLERAEHAAHSFEKGLSTVGMSMSSM